MILDDSQSLKRPCRIFCTQPRLLLLLLLLLFLLLFNSVYVRAGTSDDTG